MSYISNKIGVIKDAFMGNLMKLKFLYDIRFIKSITLSAEQEASVIISLTSYGKRIKNSVAYTAYSLMKQTLRAERIVLWLNEKEYNTNNIPSDLRFLCNYGLEIRFCKDIGSYTKIIHALSDFPDKNIITADDDIYYTKNFVKEFVETHRLHPEAIITGLAKIPQYDIDNHLSPYYNWQEIHYAASDFKYDERKLFPLGIGGVLYPIQVFDNEVFNESIFTSLCPKADDIWLYIMGLRSNAEKRLITESRISYYHTDLLRQYITKDRLTVRNRLEGKNDTQLQALLTHYNISI